MANIKLRYDPGKPVREENKIKYLFESINQYTSSQTVKAIEYSNLDATHNSLLIFNLGFGDYDIKTNSFDDSSLTANGDTYKIFNTVLSTVPAFFETFPDSALFISGSDSTDEFEKKCKQNCTRNNCINSCKKRGQRIKTYCNYVNKHYDSLVQEYHILGGVITNKDTNHTSLIEFKKGEIYDALLIYKKKIL